MERRAAEYFLAVVEHGSMTAAAGALYISQPTLSVAIRKLEQQLGATLFERSTRALTLTDAGRSLLEPARQILVDIDRAQRTVRDVVSLRGGELAGPAVPAHAVDPLPALVARLRERLPDVRVVLRSGSTDAVETDLRAGRCEAAITDGPVRAGDELCHHQGEDQEIVLVLPEGSSLPDPLPRHRLNEMPLVLELEDRWLRSELGEYLTHVVVDCEHRQAMRALVSSGAGAALMSRGTAARAVPDHTIVALDPPPRRPFVVVHRGGAPSPAVTEILAAAGMACAGVGSSPVNVPGRPAAFPAR
ncbi:Cyn operon transcriptional activator [Pseudonocardia sp. Ae168_Ps1]|uniref:LysR family transcriptional regulator n=1 Tax=unclassified Pseudonocardia TaxID=2619320 RepID=UPI00094B6844|nr:MULTISPECIES: LysR family transcriptional regulator [unclassified Pseudonocardia]OLL76824.1 Cyn operon transcriptional activator [Pseudonocardia sp. Ae150A_Ps1]OLL82838.1 Cyn operon transcriptional activator [Pseudonocardia sp. Ae168_Ps1]OLL83050.1 Cyn operon transcriptional activator [Pseudonocardia sp. Ae263_Ps1]OLL90911.1 Cyn operon transcriptional activator [Pseudonocardia sp. Ae356_Ps1]